MIPWTPLERRWRDQLLAAMVPAPDNAELPGLDAIDTESFWEEYHRAAPALLRFGFRFSVSALSLLPPLVIARPATFARLGTVDRDRFLSKVSQSRLFFLRQLSLTVKLMACFAYLRDADVRQRVEALDSPGSRP